MRKLCVIIAILIFSSFLHGQPAKITEVKNTDKPKETKDKKQTIAKNTDDPLKTPIKSKFNLPPEKLNPVKVPKIEPQVIIDGKPDEEAWKQAAVFKDFYQTFPGDNIAPSKPTEALMLYDEKHLYIAFKCWDEKDKIRATFAKRDEVFGEDNVRVWLDTYNDQRRAYVLGFNPYGI